MQVFLRAPLKGKTSARMLSVIQTSQERESVEPTCQIEKGDSMSSWNPRRQASRHSDLPLQQNINHLHEQGERHETVRINAPKSNALFLQKGQFTEKCKQNQCSCNIKSFWMGCLP